MQIATIAGNVGKAAEVKTTQGGDTLCRFSVAVTTGWGDKKATTWWDVTRWGKGAEKLAEFVTKGSKVSVSGEVSTREHEGKTYLQIRADHVTLQGGDQNRSNSTQSGGNQRNSGGDQQRSSSGHRHDLDDDVPF
jgi:single-strand DNA-binding protein